MRCSEGSGLRPIAARPVLFDEAGVDRLPSELGTSFSPPFPLPPPTLIPLTTWCGGSYQMNPLAWLRSTSMWGGSDLVRTRAFASELMSAEADSLCGAGYGDARRSGDSRNGSDP